MLQVRSEFNMTLMAWNPNTLPKCFTTFRHIIVSVLLEGQQILHEEVSLELKLEPQKSRTIVLKLVSKGYPVNEESAWMLDFELRKWKSVELEFAFKVSRYVELFEGELAYTTTCLTTTELLPQGNFSKVKFCESVL